MSATTSGQAQEGLRRVATDSVVGSAWTMVSRVSGLVRVSVVAAVLGPTQFANLYQSTVYLPTFAYELLAGTLFVSMLVPGLVRHFDRGDPAAAARLVTSFLTLCAAAALALTALVILAGPLVVAGLTSRATADSLRAPTGVAWLLLGLVMLQVPLYVVVGAAIAVQNARGRFALPAGASAVENLGVTAVMGMYVLLFGTGAEATPGAAQVAVLGAGTTAAAALHAAVQWWGAHRCGAHLGLVRHPWRHPEVPALVRLALPSVGNAGLAITRYLVVIVVAGAVPGGVIAFTIAWSFYALPIALGAKPVAQAALPRLSRAVHHADDADYSEILARSLGLAQFLAVPAAVGLALISGPLSTAITFGEMAGPEGRKLLQYGLLGISLGVIGDAAANLGTQAAYARRDARLPFLSALVRTVSGVLAMLVAVAVLQGPALLFGIGLSITLSDLLAGYLLCAGLRRGLPRTRTSMLWSMARTVGASLAMVPVVLALTALAGPSPDRTASTLLVVGGAVAGGVVYLLTQWALRSPEISGVLGLLRGRGAAAEADRA